MIKKKSTLVLVVVLLSISSGKIYGQGFNVLLESLQNKLNVKQQEVALSYGGGDFSRSGIKGSTSSLGMFGLSYGVRTKFLTLTPTNNYVGISLTMGSTSGESNSTLNYKDVGLGETNALACTMISFENREAYGYYVGDKTEVLLSTGGKTTWTSVTPKSYSATNSGDWQKIDDFASGFNFGYTWSPGIEINTTSNFGVRIGYNWTQAYSRHMFWYWAGSELIEDVARSGARILTNSLSSNGESAYPIIHFVISNAVGYLFNELRSENMNWPFDTAAPMNFKYWNISVNYAF